MMYRLSRPRAQQSSLLFYILCFVSVFLGLFGVEGARGETQYLYIIDSWSNQLHKRSLETYAELATVTITTNTAQAVSGSHGAAVNPVTDALYAVLKLSGPNGRYLTSLNVETGLATVIGNLGDNFSAITFDDDGKLFGLTGDGATVPSTLYEINPANASKTLLASYVANNDGETLSFAPESQKLMRISGSKVYEIDRADPTNPVERTDVPFVFYDPQGLVHYTDNVFFYGDAWGDVHKFDLGVMSIHGIGGNGKGTKSLVVYPLSLELVNSAPESGALDQAVRGLSITLDFEEKVYSGSGSFFLKKVADNLVEQDIPVSSPRVSGWGTKELKIELADLSEGTEYYLNIESTAIKNMHDKYFSGITDSTALRFTTVRTSHSQVFEEAFSHTGFLDATETSANLVGAGKAQLPQYDWWGFGENIPDFSAVEEVNGMAWWPRMRLDNVGNPIVAWNDNTPNNYEILLSRWNGSSWVKMNGTPGVDNISSNSGGSWNPSLELDPSGNPIVAWYDKTPGNDDIFLARWNGSSWVKMDGTPGVDNISSNSGGSSYPILSLDPSDYPIVAWYDNTQGNYEIFLKRWNGSSWVKMDGTAGVENVSSNSGDSSFPSLELDPSGHPIVAWRDNTPGNDEIFLKRWNGSSWVKMDGTPGVENISSNSGKSYEPSLELDPSGNPILAWYDDTPGNYEILLKRWNGSTWVKMDGTPGIDNISSNSGPSGRPSLGLDPSGNPIVAWQDETSGNYEIFLARWDGSTWGKMDGTLGVNNVSSSLGSSYTSFHSLALTPSGKPMLVWFETKNFWQISISQYDPKRLPEGTLQSKSLNGSFTYITRATLTAEDVTSGGGSITYYLSNDGGLTWHEVQKGIEYLFPVAGDDLRYQAVLVDGTSSPEIEGLRISYGDLEELTGALTSPSWWPRTDDLRPQFTGTGEANGSVKVWIDGVLVGTSPIDSSGNWSFYPTNALSIGNHEISFSVLDPAGHESLQSASSEFEIVDDYDHDGLTTEQENNAGTDPHDADSDDDGVNDGEELSESTNPLDRGSVLSRRDPTLCIEWNGFLDMWNVLEHLNMSTSKLTISSTLRSLAGAAQDPVSFVLKSGYEYDLLVHDLPGFARESYGLICSSAVSGGLGDLDGRMVFYKPDVATGGYQFAFALPLGNGLKGKQYVPYNTFQPSLDGGESGNLAANWIQLTNLGGTKQSGSLVFYSQAGQEIARQAVTLKAGARFDFSAHDLAGVKQVGLVEWMPAQSTAPFQLRNVRYYYRADGEVVPLGDDFDSACQLEGIVGNGELLTVPLDTAGSSSVLEISNTLAEEVKAEVKIFAASGATILHHQTYKLAPHATYHLITDSVLGGNEGIATVQGNKPASVIATAMQYKRTESLGLQNVYGIAAGEPLGTVLRGTYNTFLQQGCRLLMANPTDSEARATISMKRYDGTAVELGRLLAVPAHGLTDYDLCREDEENVYGVVSVQPEAPNTIFATVLRIGENEEYRFPTPVRE